MKNPFILSTLTLVPVALGLNPAGRWGHQAVYVPSQAAMYIVGGQVSTSDNQITNDVLVLPLNTTKATFSLGANNGLPPHAFASMAITPDESSLVVIGGMTSSCSSDGLGHTMDLDQGDWTSISPASVVRRRGAEMAWVDTGSGKGAMMVVGGMADNYACASTASAYTASDILALPLRASSLLSSRSLPSSLTGTDLAVADYAMTSNNGTIYLIGGQSSSGALVSLTTIGVWDESTGWHSKTTSGDVPSARIGATLVAHPSLDLLIMHGGSTSTSGTDSPTELLALLNTTSMVWSTPSDLQPPASAAKSYHSSIMTPSGIMITAFGLSSSNTARSDLFYLDARNPSVKNWSWASSWTTEMLQPLQSTIKTPGTSAESTSDGLSGGAIAGIVVPLLLFAIIGLPIIVYLVRRRMRLIKKRRMAEHFSFSSQEDGAGGNNDNFASRFFGAGRRASGRITNAQYPFGRDANEKEGTFITDLGNRARGLLKRYSTRSSTNSSLASRNMDQDANDVNLGGYTEKELRPMRATMNPKTAKWEEIDFGLGRLDESRRASGVDAYESSAMVQTDVPLIRLDSNDEDDDDNTPLAQVRQQQRLSSYGSPTHDGQMPLIPSLVIQPPSNPSTPGSAHTPIHPSPLQASNPFADPMPTVHEYESTPVALTPQSDSNANELDWSALQKELDDKPAFRSISPNSTLRSHSHSHPHSYQPQHPQAQPQSPPNYGRNIMNPITRLPVPAQIPTSPSTASPLARASSDPHSPSQSQSQSQSRPRSATPPQLPPLDLYEPFGRTITLVSPKVQNASGPGSRRLSGTLPFSGRRGSLPQVGSGSGSSAIAGFIAGAGTGMARSPSSSGSTTPTAGSPRMNYVTTPRRSSNPVPLAQYSPTLGSGTQGQRRASAMSRLRVMNPSSDDETTSTESLGQAL